MSRLSNHLGETQCVRQLVERQKERDGERESGEGGRGDETDRA